MSATDGKLREQVQSPCIRLCTLDDADICVGCYRSIDEICAWGRASDAERLSIIEAATARKLDRKACD
jgi:predicted Fe-S protein YdhL (DUF1289 family)